MTYYKYIDEGESTSANGMVSSYHDSDSRTNRPSISSTIEDSTSTLFAVRSSISAKAIETSAVRDATKSDKSQTTDITSNIDNIVVSSNQPSSSSTIKPKILSDIEDSTSTLAITAVSSSFSAKVIETLAVRDATKTQSSDVTVKPSTMTMDDEALRTISQSTTFITEATSSPTTVISETGNNPTATTIAVVFVSIVIAGSAIAIVRSQQRKFRRMQVSTSMYVKSKHFPLSHLVMLDEACKVFECPIGA